MTLFVITPTCQAVDQINGTMCSVLGLFYWCGNGVSEEFSACLGISETSERRSKYSIGLKDYLCLLYVFYRVLTGS